MEPLHFKRFLSAAQVSRPFHTFPCQLSGIPRVTVLFHAYLTNRQLIWPALYVNFAKIFQRNLHKFSNSSYHPRSSLPPSPRAITYVTIGVSSFLDISINITNTCTHTQKIISTQKLFHFFHCTLQRKV